MRLARERFDEEIGTEDFLHEVQVARKLQHPNILSVINAGYIDDHFVIAMELGDESLADRIERRISTARAMDLAGQALAAMPLLNTENLTGAACYYDAQVTFAERLVVDLDVSFTRARLKDAPAGEDRVPVLRWVHDRVQIRCEEYPGQELPLAG